MNHTLHAINDFRNIVLEKTALIDIRAPIEFQKGTLPNSINLPIMNDEERHLIGICHKQDGNKKAIELGHKLISGSIKKDRVEAWLKHLRSFPDSYIFCHRGGQRSTIAQQWLSDAGCNIKRVQGGHKAFRRYLIEELDSITHDKELITIAGHTGSGKTILLKKLSQSVDLEAIANHRGSSFGRHASMQPTQIDFENSLAYSLINHDAKGYERIIMEDESNNIGKCYIPHNIFAQMSSSKVILLETTLADRIVITHDEYVLKSQAEYKKIFTSNEMESTWIETMRHSFKCIRRRLGDKRYREFVGLLEEAWRHQKKSNDSSLHKIWIKKLLVEYYDPMYRYQIEQKRDRIIFSGNQSEILEYLDSH